METVPDFTSSAILRILDANLDRAREGVRIIEEWCRFGLNDAQLTEECKQIRQELGRWHTPEIRAARDTPGDPGTELSHPQEEHRSGLTQVLVVNFSRVQEALRVLEEYGKVGHGELASSAKQLRYRTYTLESQLVGQQRLQKLRRSPLYLVTSPVENIFATVEAALRGGLTLVQYRDKERDDESRYHVASKLCQICHQYNALFIVNDRVDLALAVDADGVHLGQQDMPVAFARRLLGPERILGRSTTNPDEMHRALDEGADYIGVGPVYETPTKAGKAAAGLDYIRYAAENSPVPWFAIGGINTENVTAVIGAGAQRVSVVRAIMEAPDPTLATQFFIAQLARHGR
ncbi:MULTISPECIES: thiamine phosphate synthase [unclassified Leptolyngbya]|uniref:thiamine phosphate synthase n=1 Tax=unclassified Leptolyngbya TaxID=2650499 RepID=UPI001683F0CE|nr:MULTISPECIES: thiamine phosphate synthase [unclassified Leptolyngbya]MBD1914200.1 thiamine phosphate synthase [Leptolyngbya sp. FACHB-8]MBD2157207.1 thiamine phosphate synthase [Leptolyngbya sp. FACHB-16]